MMQGLKKFGTGTGESYRYPDATVTASAVWRLRIVFGTKCTRDYVARDPVMGIIIPMKPAIEGDLISGDEGRGSGGIVLGTEVLGVGFKLL